MKQRNSAIKLEQELEIELLIFISRFKNSILCDPRLFTIVQPKGEDDHGMDELKLVKT